LRKELAARCGVSAQTVSNWERAHTVPSTELVARIASVLSFPEDFFYRDELDRMPAGAASFRARSRIPSRHKHAALAAGDLARELAAWIEERFELPEVRLPALHGQGPELAAQVLRTEWLLGQRSVPNMIHLLESRGVLVFSLAQDCRAIDAFSFWSGSRPIVLLNTLKSAERSRIDAAHELFHLVAHSEETGKKEEEEAESFAGAFLMPADDILQQVPPVVSLPYFIQIKQRWGVSLPALVYRLHKLSRLTDWQYRSLFIEISKRGYRTSEPNSIPRERSALLAKVFISLRQQGIMPRQIANSVGWPIAQLQEFLFGLGATILSLDGGGSGASDKQRDHLRLV
jgi:Zn-dependent peptidase ImmA (M78 family)/DNA-binding XRE family transcriptional regulator